MDKGIKAFIGAVYTVSGIILFGFVHLVVGSYLPNMGGWGIPPGKYIEGLNETAGTIPAIIAIILFVIGIAILSKAYKNL